MGLLSADQAATHLHLNVKRVQALARAGKPRVDGSDDVGCSMSGTSLSPSANRRARNNGVWI